MSDPSSSLPFDVTAIHHHEAASRFEALTSGHLSVLDYTLKDGQMVITHTLVPPALRGRGIAAELVKHALQYARDHDLIVVPECSYVAAYMARHKEQGPRPLRGRRKT